MTRYLVRITGACVRAQKQQMNEPDAFDPNNKSPQLKPRVGKVEWQYSERSLQRHGVGRRKD